MYEYRRQVYFDTLTEAKMALLVRASDSTFAEAEKLPLIEALQKSIEQHDSREKLLTIIHETGSPALRQWMQPTLDIVERSLFGVLPCKVINEHPLIGGSETFISANLFLNPTDRMVDVRNKVSKVLLTTLEYYQDRLSLEDTSNVTCYFLRFAFHVVFELSAATGDTAYPGLFYLEDVNAGLPQDEKISPEALELNLTQARHIINLTINRLKSPHTRHYEVMAIHTQFAYCVQRKIPLIASDDAIDESSNPVSGRILEEYNQNHNPVDMSEFLRQMRLPDDTGNECRQFVSDTMMYKKDFYFFEPDRGRGEPDATVKTNTLGVMRCKVPAMQAKLPSLDLHAPWVDWTQCPARYSSSTLVAAFVRHETPFISSYSGTISLLAGLMIATNALTYDEQIIYCTNGIGYIAGSGLHSLHEIIAPLAHCLNLLSNKDYPVDALPSVEHYKAPQYYSFFQRMMEIDPQFAVLRSHSWAAFIDWYRTVYIPNAENTPFKVILTKLVERCLRNPEPEQISFLSALLHSPLEPEYFTEFDQIIAAIYQQHKLTLLPLLHSICGPSVSTVSSSSSSTAYERAIELIKRQVTIDAQLQRFFEGYKSFRFSYSNGTLYLVSIKTEGGYRRCNKPLYKQSTTIHLAMQKAGISPEVISGIMQVVKNTPIREDSLKFSDESITHPFVESLLANNSSEKLHFDWKKLVVKITRSRSNTVLKKDDERQHLVFHNTGTDKVHKIKTLRKNLWDELQETAKEEALFKLINKKTIRIENTTDYVEIIMPFLGRPLSELTHLHGTEQWDVIREKAANLVKSLHREGYVHGDISLQNFLLNANGELFLIDFETSRKIKPSKTACRLKLFSIDLRHHGINPEQYTPADELRMLTAVFNQVCVQPDMSDSATPESLGIL
ncbi:RIO1 family regulatory kinase/ATPase domain-containing protein [Legionella sp. CNM-4043-24]|uniref:RIO1 family regulatory kinase/ATPase domain-containing protein n=1 Tax=Legionella sp. CNM-4043-24 TaxID=3421646 RepID=UPI00403A81E7